MPFTNISETVGLTYEDIIFQTRNRAYGAFDLRKRYKPTLSRALGLGVGLFLGTLAAPTIYARFWPHESVNINQSMTEATLTKLAEPPAELPIFIPPVEQAPAVNTVRNLPPTTEQLQDATSGTQTAEGTGDIDIIAAPEATIATAIEKAVEVDAKAEAPFTIVEQQPEYPGGLEALRTFLGKNLNYPRSAASAGVSGRVYVSFVVNTDGSLTDLQVLKGIGFGCDEEAVRVMQKMPHWRPGKQSGRAVRVKYNLPISFTLE